MGRYCLTFAMLYFFVRVLFLRWVFLEGRLKPERQIFGADD